MKKHIIAVFSQNKPGVLSRIAGLLRRKLFQIDSLTVGKTSNPKISRFTIVIEGEEEDANKTALAVENLIEVLSVKILPKNSITREIILARFRIKNAQEAAFLHEAENDILTKEIARSKNEITLELIDTSRNLDSFLKKIKTAKIEIIEWVRSGVIAI